MMTANEHIIYLDLQEFFADDRRRSKILINENCRKIIDLEEKIGEIFGITSFHLLSDGHFLPSGEDIALIKSGEIVCVRPSICPSKSNLLDKSFYKSSNTEKNLKDEAVQKDIVPKDESNKEYHIEVADSIPKRRKKKHSIKENNDTIEVNEYALYASTPNNTNVSPGLTYPQENEEMIERPLCLSGGKKKKKTKLEKNSKDSGFELKKAKKRKHQVLDGGISGDDCKFNRNSAENEEVCRVRKKRKKFTPEKTERIDNPTTNADFTDDADVGSSNQEISNSYQKNNVNIIKIDIIRESTNTEKVKKEGDVRCEDLDNSNSKVLFQDQNLDKECRSKDDTCDTVTDKFHPRPLPHIKARDKESWSTLPLSKTTNIVKIIKLPIDKIEIDLSRFVFVPNVYIPHETPEEKNTSNTVDDISQTHTVEEAELKNASCNKLPANKSKSSEPNSLSTSPTPRNMSKQIKFTLESSQNQPIPNSDVEKQNYDGDKTSTNQNSSSNQNLNNLEADENSQDSTRSRNEVLQVWRKKICEKTQGFKIAQLSNLNEPALKNCSSANKNEIGESDVKKSEFNPIVNEEIGNNSTLIDTQSIKMQDTTKEYSSGTSTNICLGTQDISEFVEIIPSNRISSPTIEEDSSLSISIASDFGQSLETKRKRRRRHKKKKKNEIPENFLKEEFKVTWVNNVSFVPAKPKIHVRFEDSDNDLPGLQNNTENETQGLGENMEMTENVILDTSSQCEPEISLKAPESEQIPEVPNEIERIHRGENEDTSDRSRSQEFSNSSNGKLERYKTELLRIVDAMNAVKNQDSSCQNNSSP